MRCRLLSLWFLLIQPMAQVQAAEPEITISPDWTKIVGVTKTVVSIQVCPEPPMRRGSAIHDQLFAALRDLKADYARLQPWRTYPKLAVAELYPPKNGRTSWDFSLIDPMVEDFMAATEGRPVIFSFSTIPSWMVRTKKSDVIPQDPDEITWVYGTEPEFTDFDSTVKLFAEYQARLAAWYIQGGFQDEYGKRHVSGHHYNNIVYWGVLDETRVEHSLTSAQYTQIFDTVVAAVRQVAPTMKFIGLSDDDTVAANLLPDRYPYFLDSANHAGNSAVDAIAYHYYARPDWDENAEVIQHTTFKEADQLLTAASYIEVIRQRLAPRAQTIVEELGGSFLPWAATSEQLRRKSIDHSYWNLSGAMWAYIYGHLVSLGVDMVHGAELIDYPGQAASATLMDWDTGKPNARYWVLKLVHDHFGPGDSIIETPSVPADVDASDYAALYPATKVYSQSFITQSGVRKVLLVNKRSEPERVVVTGASGSMLDVVEQGAPGGLGRRPMRTDHVALGAFSVAVVTLPSPTHH